MCEETFFFRFAFWEKCRGTADFSSAPRLCPEAVVWKTAPPADSLGPQTFASKTTNALSDLSPEFHNCFRKCENRNCTRYSWHSKFETVWLKRELNSKVDRTQLFRKPAKNTVWSLPPSSSSPSSFSCPFRFRPCTFARIISFQDTRHFIVFFKACGQRITSKSTQDEQFWGLSLGIFKSSGNQRWLLWPGNLIPTCR